MAGWSANVCYVCVIFLLLLQLSDSTNDWDENVEYSLVDDVPSDFNTVFASQSFHPLRAKREAPETLPPAPSTLIVNSTLPTTTDTPTTQPTTSELGSAQSATTQLTTSGPGSAQPATTQPTTSTSDSDDPFKDDDTQYDGHDYYSSQYIPGGANEYYVTLDNPQTYDQLNAAHRLAATISLPIPFLFYGHSITQITIATGGFLHAGPFVHKFMASTQYIAPLMANFHTGASNDSNIYYQQVGNEFIVEWSQVLLKDEEDKGAFDFQAKLKSDGTITFVYKTLPVPERDLVRGAHPITVGLSDAFYRDFPQRNLRVIYEYHRVNLTFWDIKEGVVIILTPLPTCNRITDCEECAVHEGVNFNCRWCRAVGRCSSGFDWYRQDWESKGCLDTAHADKDLCNVPLTTETTPGHSQSPTPSLKPIFSPTPFPYPKRTTSSSTADHVNSSFVSAIRCPDGDCKKSGSGLVAVIAVVVILVIILVAVGAWVYYAYTHPSSRSGIWLMEHRPSVMKAKLANMKPFKKSQSASAKYAVESTA